ncbi:Crp/Fnr family transcriptional regulator [Marinobacter sp. F4206]|uniref:Crp/Fnr family transcriptional regulator n=1 Tax=Marinobacter sp. F4206 TaxID=2861777 RepID=UPI001C5D4210|nr:Crp/Fnr family transcriptional regulator [Marinobacter sp. F4206]MBW4934116.1 Crp/Fnr family transcriptional regulator [Marinobacter sp. F4206]
MREIDALDYWQEKGPAYFSELSTFGALPEEPILRMLKKGRIIGLDAGERLYSVGEPSEAFYIVLSGIMNSWMPRKDGGWTLARCHEPGDDMGFVPMISLSDRPATTKADEDSVVLEITCGHFLDLHLQEPEVFGLMLLNLTRGMARTIITMASMLAEQDSQLHRIYPKAPGSREK